MMWWQRDKIKNKIVYNKAMNNYAHNMPNECTPCKLNYALLS